MTAIRKAAMALALGSVLVGAAGPALADSQPSQGIRSTDRNDAGFGGGPHCHVQAVAGGQQDEFDTIVVYPSHTGHASSNTAGAIFQADPNCDGNPG